MGEYLGDWLIILISKKVSFDFVTGFVVVF